eukprot:gnl/MRDRNA2_/MRDRNA2_75115_c0_seq1.p1 gnl/MRDRNA2_/MRDRNA2_75115_c0~~gnl/MRDRNA2_/MRDRNA2_75115_c0_seq1.p1  ORF type:complete len:458 (+),score=72.66 gnl/MRDRNA2_/MRDRNA2_75115_c0_seq1:64-1437(+)
MWGQTWCLAERGLRCNVWSRRFLCKSVTGVGGPLHPARRCFSSTGSILVTGETDPEVAVGRVVEGLKGSLGDKEPTCTLWFAKGYGMRAAPIGPYIQERLGGVVIGSAAEGGLIGQEKEVQRESFAISALSIAIPKLTVYPFHSADLGSLPALGRGGSWASLSMGGKGLPPPCILSFVAHGGMDGVDVSEWIKYFDNMLASRLDSTSSRLPAVVGGLCVSNYIYVDGEIHNSGGFGLVLQPEDEDVSLDTIVCQGALPVGPQMEITDAHGPLITEINGNRPQTELEPIMEDIKNQNIAGYPMAGIFVDAAAPIVGQQPRGALKGRPECLIRQMLSYTEEGYLLLAPLADGLSYMPGLQLQVHRLSPEDALAELRRRAESDRDMQQKTPDAAVIISCGARGVSLYGEESKENGILRGVWGRSVPSVGFFAAAEVGPVGLQTYVHGYTTSALFLRGSSS